MPCFVYIALCNDKAYYTGITSNLDRRLWEHNHRVRSSLQISKLPIKIIFTERYNTRVEAAKREKEIKGWSRTKKEYLINKGSSLH